MEMRAALPHGVAWDPASGRRVSVSTPYWVFQATRWKAKALGTVVKRFDQQLGLDVDPPDLAPLVPVLVLDERYPGCSCERNRGSSRGVGNRSSPMGGDRWARGPKRAQEAGG